MNTWSTWFKRVAVGLLALWLFFLLVSPRFAHGQRVARRQQVTLLLKVSASRLLVRELTGHNDGPAVELVQKLAGAQKYDPWCGCERYYWNYLSHLPTPAWPAAARNWSPYSSPRVYYVRDRRGTLDSLRIGDTVTFYYANLGRVGHVGMPVSRSLRSVRRGRFAAIYCIRAGNTGRGGGRDGAGVHDVFYSATDIYAAARW